MILCLPLLANAQRSDILEQYIQDAIQHNLSLKQERLEIEKSIENVNQARANFMPKVTFNPNYSLAAGGRKLSFPVGDLLNPVYSTLNQLTRTNNFPQIENVNQQLIPNNFHDTKFSFQYPIFNTDIRYNLLIQRDLLSAEEAKKKVMEQDIRFLVTNTYLQYLQTLEAKKIYTSSKKILEDFVELNQKLVKNQVATKDIIYSSEYEVSKIEQEIAMMDKNSKLLQSYLNFLMNKDFSQNIIADSNIVKQNFSSSNLSELKENAIQNRQEIKQINTGINIASNNIKLLQMNAIRPQLFVGGNLGFQGFGYTFRQQAYAIAQIGLSWDLYHGYEKKSKIQQAKIQKNILETKAEEIRQQIQLQITQAFFELEASQKSYQTAQIGTLKAEKYFKIIASNYNNGQAIVLEYLKASNDITTAKLQESIAKYDILIKQAALEKAAAIN